MQQARTDAGAGCGVARDAVAGHEQVGAVVDVEQRALRTLEQQVDAGLVRLVELARDIGHHRADRLGLLHRLSNTGSNWILPSTIQEPARRPCISALPVGGQRMVVQLEQLAQLGGEALGCLRSCTRRARRAILSS